MAPKRCHLAFGLLTFQITQTRKYRFVLFKTRFLGTAGELPDPPEMEHELQLATHQQRAGGQDDVSLNKLPQITVYVQRDSYQS